MHLEPAATGSVGASWSFAKALSLAVLALCEVLAMSLWFSASAMLFGRHGATLAVTPSLSCHVDLLIDGMPPPKELLHNAPTLALSVTNGLHFAPVR